MSTTDNSYDNFLKLDSIEERSLLKAIDIYLKSHKDLLSTNKDVCINMTLRTSNRSGIGISRLLKIEDREYDITNYDNW